MHFMNAYNDGDAIVVDYIHRPSFDLDTAAGVEQAPTLHRCVIELGRGVVSDEMLDPTPVDLPRIDDRRTGLRYRYGYLAAVTHGDGRPNGVGFDTLLRYDLQAERRRPAPLPGRRRRRRAAVRAPAATASPRATAGSSRSPTTSRTTAASSSIIDAEDFAARPVAVVQLPRRVPAGLHGTWLPAATPSSSARQ